VEISDIDDDESAVRNVRLLLRCAQKRIDDSRSLIDRGMSPLIPSMEISSTNNAVHICFGLFQRMERIEKRKKRRN